MTHFLTAATARTLRAAMVALVFIACKRPESAPVAAHSFHPEWSKNAVLYEVNVRQYTPEGTFVAFAQQIPRLKALGISALWIMPVQPIGKLNRKGSLGSYYSISNYHEINPEFGSLADFTAMVNAAHAAGMRVILDWVANHTSFDHAWTVEHKDYYTLKADGTISRAIDDKGKETDWTDVADLNYGNKDMRKVMLGEMQWWLDHTPIDGFRCDVAGFVPYDFWQQVSDTFRPSRPNFFMLAEWEDPKLHASFDMTYNWELYHLLNDVTQGKQSTAQFSKFFAAQQLAYGHDAYRMNFTSNHDENSWNGSEFERMGANHVPAYVLSALAKNSMALLYTGQEASLKKRLRFFDKDTVDWTGPSLADFYGRIFELKHTEPAVWNGPYGGTQIEIASNGGDKVYGFERVADSSGVTVFVNFAPTATTVSYHGLASPGPFTDWFSHSAVTLSDSGSIDIPANGFRVLVRNKGMRKGN